VCKEVRGDVGRESLLLRPLPPITQTLLSNFTGIVGVVIAFYFGASAYVEAHSKRGTANETSPDNEDRTST
jgi:hypothetical protein